jgi:hypothetical protein
MQHSVHRSKISLAKPNSKPKKAAVPLAQKDNYFADAKRPIVSLYFLLPLILCYEIAKIFASVQQLGSGIDLWIHNLLNALGAGQLVVLPLLTTAVLLFCHHRIDDNWNVQGTTLLKMAGESIGIGIMLFCFANLFQIAAVQNATAGQLADPYFWQIGSSRWWASVMTYVGTGIHEELVFRVILMLPAIAVMKDVLCDEFSATVIAVAGVAVLFAAAHVNFFNPWGEPLEVTSFAFRGIASIIFSAVFIYRGFAIVVCAHIVYNVLTLLA